jgi:hypothetical protein
LVWSGAPLFENRIAFDFKVVQISGASHLSLIMNKNDVRDADLKGAGVIMDSHYTIQQKVYVQDSPDFNMHEFNIIEDGHTALAITWIPTWYNLEPEQEKSRYAWVANNGFQEIDLRTNEVLFDWHSLDHINTSASKIPVRRGSSYQQAWDWM